MTTNNDLQHAVISFLIIMALFLIAARVEFLFGY